MAAVTRLERFDSATFLTTPMKYTLQKTADDNGVTVELLDHRDGISAVVATFPFHSIPVPKEVCAHDLADQTIQMIRYNMSECE